MPSININVVKASFESGNDKYIRIKVGGKEVRIPVDEGVYAYFHEQFLRKNPTALQEKRFATTKNVLRAAYLRGLEDGKAGR